MKNKSLFTPRQATRGTAVKLVLASAATPFLLSYTAHAANATWNGSPTDATWATVGNWAGPPASVPGTGETATFNNAGGADDVINLGSGVTVNALIFDTASVAAYTLGSGAVGSQTLTLNDGGSVTLNNTIAQNQLINVNLALGTGATITNNDTTETLTIAGGITGTGSSLTKTGAGTLILSGLSTTAANNYMGTTILGGGTTTLTADASFTGGLTFGATGGSANVSNLNLNNASATFAGAMLVQTNNTAAPNNTITIGAGQKLTINANVNFGIASNDSRQRLTVSGAGGWDVVSSDGLFGGIGTPAGSGGAPALELDMSGLAEFNVNLRTGGSGDAGGVFRAGYVGGGTNTRNNNVSLATNSTISADIFELRGASVGTTTLRLGDGEQIINSDLIRMGVGTNRADTSNFSFRTANGTLKIRGTDGGNTTRSNLSMISTPTASGNNVISIFDVAGHQADLLFDTVSVYNSNANTADSATQTYSATFSFDRGTLDATTLNIGRKVAGQLRNAGLAVVNIGSSANLTNTATFGTVNMGELLTTNGTTVNGKLDPTLNISGTATTVGFTTLSMANYTGTTGATLNSKVNISGGTTTGTGGINMAAGDKNGITSSLNITGGSLSVGTGGVTATNGIYRTTASVNATTTLRLNGGSLNLNGNSIGGSGANAITTQFESGTLSNVGEINGGAGLTKTTTGTLSLTGTNTYTGDTLVSAGTLLVNGSLGNTAVTVESGGSIGGTGSLAGSLGLNAGAKLDLTGASLGLTSTNILSANSTITLTNFAFSSIIGWDYANATNGIYTLINGGSSVTLAGTTPTISNPFDLGGGKSGYFQAGSLQAVIVPEPRAALLGSIGMLMLLRRRRA